MAIEGLTSDILAHAAASEEPIVLERAPYVITIDVRRMESWEMPEPDPEEPITHPLSYGPRLGNRVRTQ